MLLRFCKMIDCCAEITGMHNATMRFICNFLSGIVQRDKIEKMLRIIKVAVLVCGMNDETCYTRESSQQEAIIFGGIFMFIRQENFN